MWQLCLQIRACCATPVQATGRCRRWSLTLSSLKPIAQIRSSSLINHHPVSSRGVCEIASASAQERHAATLFSQQVRKFILEK